MRASTSRRRQSAVLLLALGSAAVAGVAGLSWLRLRHPVGLLQTGRQAYKRGDWERAANLARERLKQARDDQEALRLLARSSVRLGRDSSAMSLYQQLGLSAMEADDLYLVGTMLARAGKAKESSYLWQEVLKENPDHPAALFEMIQVHLKAERFTAAAAAARRLARQATWKNRAKALLGWVEVKRDNPAQAIELWKDIDKGDSVVPEDRSPPLVSRKDLARALLRVQRPAEALDQLQRVLADGPDPEASWLMSRAYLQEGAWDQALAVSRAASSFSEENSTVPEPAPWTGAASCAPCHLEKYQAQQKSRHARTFHRLAELLDLRLPRSPFPDPADSKVMHELRQAGNVLRQETRTAEHIYQAVVDYAFGSGDQGKTLVGHDQEGSFYELRLSVYHENTSDTVWDITSGHARRPRVDKGLFGLPLTTDAVRRCFSCHVTNPRAFLEGPLPGSVDHAIGCERCHGPGGNHLLAVKAKFPDVAIARPSLASGARIVQICAQCHSPKGIKVEMADPISVRFQGATLTWSRCYTESRDKLDCVTCHDPHHDAETDAAHYEAKCLACHPGGESSEKALTSEQPMKYDLTDVPHAPTCPVSPSRKCVSCHMPKVNNVLPHSSFTDHYIRVHREN